MKKLYFLCTGNSCRSQIAEGFGKKYLGSKWEIRSGGIEAHGLNPKAVKVMEEVGVDISNQQSEMIDLEYLNQADLVVTLCGDAENRCPLTPAQVKREHWGFNDPAKAIGSDDEVWQVFQIVRDAIDQRIREFVQTNA